MDLQKVIFRKWQIEITKRIQSHESREMVDNLRRKMNVEHLAIQHENEHSWQK